MSSEPAPLPPSPLDTWPPAWSPSAVVFDFDGLLVDTEAEWIRVQDAYLAMHDVRMDAATRREITGRAAEVVVTAIGALVGKDPQLVGDELLAAHRDRKSTRLNSSHVAISYAVFCLKKNTAGRDLIYNNC